jgi:8-oxo-dGTP diphosphatase
VDQGEGFETAAHREVEEELGTSVRLLQILGTTHFYRGDKQNANELIGVVYLGSIASNAEIHISPEHSEYRWVTKDEAMKFLSPGLGSEGWLTRVIERAELLRLNLTTQQMALHRETGFELDP